MYSRYSIGDEIDVRLIKESRKEGDFLLMTPKQTQKAAFKINSVVSLEEGSLVSGTLKSIKGQCAFIQVGS